MPIEGRTRGHTVTCLPSWLYFQMSPSLAVGMGLKLHDFSSLNGAFLRPGSPLVLKRAVRKTRKETGRAKLLRTLTLIFEYIV